MPIYESIRMLRNTPRPHSTHLCHWPAIRRFELWRAGGGAVGFTILEATVVMALLVIIASIVLVSFPTFTEKNALQQANQALALNLRRAQDLALAIRQITTQNGSVVPPAFGVYVSRASPSSYIIFADMKVGGANDDLYKPNDDIVYETVTLPPGIIIADLRSDVDNTNTSQNALNVVFSVPTANMTISNDSSSVGASAKISLGGQALSYTKSVTVRVSGQISTQ